MADRLCVVVGVIQLSDALVDIVTAKRYVLAEDEAMGVRVIVVRPTTGRVDALYGSRLRGLPVVSSLVLMCAVSNEQEEE